MKARVQVGFKDGVLDPQAAAIGRALATLGFDEVGGVRLSRVIEIDLAGHDPGEAETRVRDMCERLLANPVIESYRIEIEA